MTKELFELNIKQQATNPGQIPKTNDQNTPPGLENSSLFQNYPTAVALLSSFFLAISFWHILFSRLGFRAIMVPFFLVWSFYFLFGAIRINRANNTNKKYFWLVASGYWLMAGLLFGFGFHTYIAFRIAPLLLVPVLLIEMVNYWPKFKSLTADRLPTTALIKKVYLKDKWWYWDVFFIAIIIAALPLVIHFYNNPQDFMGRSSQVSVFATENPLKTMAITTAKTLGIFNVWGDCNWRHNYACKPLLPLPVGIVFLIGLFISIRRSLTNVILFLKKKTADWTFLFLLTWFLAMLLPAIMTNEGLPHALRIIGAIPPVYIFAAVGGAWIYKNLKIKNIKFKNALLITILLCIPISVHGYYFIHWGKNPEVRGAHAQYFVDIGNYLNSLPSEINKYVIVNEKGVLVPYPDGIPMPAQTIMFISRDTPNIAYIKPENIRSFTPGKQATIVLMKQEEEILDQLKERFPEGQIQETNNIWVFQLNN